MTITLEIAPEAEARVAEKAERLGLSVKEYAQHLLEHDSTPEPVFNQLSPEERAERFLQWAESHRRDTPLLTDEEISREAIYGGRD